MSGLVLSFLLASCVLAVNGLPSGRIVGGEDAPLGKYPFQISLRYAGSHTCGGSILDKRNILTAAHCVYRRDAEWFSVVVGTNFLSEGGKEYKVSEIIIHDFDYFKLKNDIAIVRVSEDIEFSKTVQPVVISESEDLSREYKGVSIGWGRLQHGGILPDKLQQLNVNIIEQDKCVKAWKLYTKITPDQVCAFTGYDLGVCHGDSGSPLLINGKQVGIASFVSDKGCAKGVPDVYTRVSAFKSWIDAKIHP